MSARDELARVLHRTLCDTDEERCDQPADEWHYSIADAVIREWLPTLAEDEALIEQTCEHAGMDPEYGSLDAAHVVTALAAALRGDA